MDFKELAKKYQTPLYVYDFNHFTEQYTSLKDAFHGRKSLICFAIKTNSNLSVIRHFARLGAGADCVSGGEIKRAIMAGVPKYQIIFSGVGKSDDEIRLALEEDILFINLESAGEMERVEAIATEMGKKARISIRVNPNVDPKTHKYISTGLHENKFGVNIETAREMYFHAHKSTYLEPVGIHFHIGSQLTDLNPIYDAACIVAEFAKSLVAAKIPLKFFDVGGGLGIVYQDETPILPYNYAQAIFHALGKLELTVICEPGRYLVGNGGYFITQVLYEKTNGEKRFVIVDGAMNDLIRPSLYQAYHHITLFDEDSEDMTLCDIVGPVCESGDFLAKNILLPQTHHGDILVVESSGAYGFVMSSNYNTRGRAAEIAVENEHDKIIRRREVFEDIIANEKEFLGE